MAFDLEHQLAKEQQQQAEQAARQEWYQRQMQQDRIDRTTRQ